jgi:hypothetical protein
MSKLIATDDLRVGGYALVYSVHIPKCRGQEPFLLLEAEKERTRGMAHLPIGSVVQIAALNLPFVAVHRPGASGRRAVVLDLRRVVLGRVDDQFLRALGIEPSARAEAPADSPEPSEDAA